MVEMCAKKFVVIVDESKMVDKLGVGGAFPVEVGFLELDNPVYSLRLP